MQWMDRVNLILVSSSHLTSILGNEVIYDCRQEIYCTCTQINACAHVNMYTCRWTCDYSDDLYVCIYLYIMYIHYI